MCVCDNDTQDQAIEHSLKWPTCLRSHCHAIRLNFSDLIGVGGKKNRNGKKSRHQLVKHVRFAVGKQVQLVLKARMVFVGNETPDCVCVRVSLSIYIHCNLLNLHCRSVCADIDEGVIPLLDVFYFIQRIN